MSFKRGNVACCNKDARNVHISQISTIKVNYLPIKPVDLLQNCQDNGLFLFVSNFRECKTKYWLDNIQKGIEICMHYFIAYLVVLNRIDIPIFQFCDLGYSIYGYTVLHVNQHKIDTLEKIKLTRFWFIRGNLTRKVVSVDTTIYAHIYIMNRMSLHCSDIQLLFYYWKWKRI